MQVGTRVRYIGETKLVMRAERHTTGPSKGTLYNGQTGTVVYVASWIGKLKPKPRSVLVQWDEIHCSQVARAVVPVKHLEVIP